MLSKFCVCVCTCVHTRVRMCAYTCIMFVNVLLRYAAFGTLVLMCILLLSLLQSRMFWRVVSHMSNAQRQQLLYFATGSATLPASADSTTRNPGLYRDYSVVAEYLLIIMHANLTSSL